MKTPLISNARRVFHQTLIDNLILTVTPEGIASNADSGNAPSMAIAKSMAQKLGANVAGKIKGQTYWKTGRRETPERRFRSSFGLVLLSLSFLKMNDAR